MTREERIKILKEQIDLYEWQAEDISAMVNPRIHNEYQNTINSLKMAIKALEQEPRWTPVSEGMPKVTDYYLIQYSREICGDEMAVAYYSVEEKESDPDYEWEFKPHCGEYKEVIAWMPLPKPYKAESVEE